MTMELRELRYFLAVDETGSVTAAVRMKRNRSVMKVFLLDGNEITHHVGQLLLAELVFIGRHRGRFQHGVVAQ